MSFDDFDERVPYRVPIRRLRFNEFRYPGFGRDPELPPPAAPVNTGPPTTPPPANEPPPPAAQQPPPEDDEERRRDDPGGEGLAHTARQQELLDEVERRRNRTTISGPAFIFDGPEYENDRDLSDKVINAPPGDRSGGRVTIDRTGSRPTAPIVGARGGEERKASYAIGQERQRQEAEQRAREAAQRRAEAERRAREQREARERAARENNMSDRVINAPSGGYNSDVKIERTGSRSYGGGSDRGDVRGGGVDIDRVGSHQTSWDGSIDRSGSLSQRGGGGGGGGGGRVICTHFMRKGRLDRALWKADLAWTYARCSDQTIRGYQAWAIPAVRAMRKGGRWGRFLETALWPVTIHRAREIAHIVDPQRFAPDYLGKAFRWTIEPVSWLIGGFVGAQDWQSLYTEEKHHG